MTSASGDAMDLLTSNTGKPKTAKHDEHQVNLCCRGCRAILEELRRDVAFIRREMTMNTTSELVENILKEEPPSPMETLNEGDLPKLPLGTPEELKSLCRLLLENPAARASYSTVVEKTIGRSPQERLRTALSSLITPSLGCVLSWTGRNNTVGVQNMLFLDLMIETILHNATVEERKNISVEDLEKVVALWLKHAGSRLQQKTALETRNLKNHRRKSRRL